MEPTVLAEESHIINLIPPVDINGAGATSDVFSMKESKHASILIQMGVTGAAVDVTVEECDDASASNSQAIPFAVYKEETDAGDTLGERTIVSSSGFSTSENDNIMYLIEVDSSELSDGYPYLRIKLSDPAAATVVSASAVLSGNRYAPAGSQLS